ncbi:MAG TPA: NACHT domain-containing protein [Micromonosporaceae bacterium]|nr:NACHT domain-containing protein [Micromonosporaceae bacterium]
MTVVLAAGAAALFGVAGNVAANTLDLPLWATPWIWATMAVLFIGVVLIDLYRNRRDRQAPVAVDLDTAAAQLATGVGRLLRAQEHLWQVHDPYPLPVRWTPGPVELTDHWANICRSAPGQRASSLDLAGHLDQITAVYQRIPSSRLVVLGKAGAGKTILAGRLVAGLLATRTHDDPIPVVLNLSTWNPTAASLEAWLAARLIEDHPGLAGPGPTSGTLAADLVTTERILPVLDGFDEIAPGLHRAALAELNRTSIPLVITSRPDEYQNAVTGTDVLTAAAVIALSDLTVSDVVTYLSRASSPTTRARWAAVLTALTSRPPTPAAAMLAEVLTTPLMVYLARIVYSDTPHHNPAELLDRNRYPTIAAIEEHLLNAFIPAVYSHPLPAGISQSKYSFSPTDATRWHTYLATHLHRLDSHDLAWWQLRDTIPRTPRAMTTTLITGLAGGLAGGLVDGLVDGLAGGLAIGLMFGLAIGLVQPGPNPQRTRFDLSGRMSALWKASLLGLMVGILVGFVNGLVSGLLDGLVSGLAIGLMFGLAIGLVQPGPYPRRTQFDLRGRMSALWKTSSLGLAFGIVGGLVAGPTFGLAMGILAGIVVGLVVGLVVGFISLLDELAVAQRVDAVFSPADLLRMDRSRTITIVIIIWLVGGLAGGVLFGIVFGLMVGFVVGLVFGLMNGLMYWLGRTAWGQWLVCVRLWLPATRKLPWPIITFLTDAHQRGVLRQAGGVYCYRHARLRDQLATPQRPASESPPLRPVAQTAAR